MMKSLEEAMPISSYCQMMEVDVKVMSRGATHTGGFGPNCVLSLIKE